MRPMKVWLGESSDPPRHLLSLVNNEQWTKINKESEDVSYRSRRFQSETSLVINEHRALLNINREKTVTEATLWVDKRPTTNTSYPMSINYVTINKIISVVLLLCYIRILVGRNLQTKKMTNSTSHSHSRNKPWLPHHPRIRRNICQTKNYQKKNELMKKEGKETFPQISASAALFMNPKSLNLHRYNDKDLQYFLPWCFSESQVDILVPFPASTLRPLNIGWQSRRYCPLECMVQTLG